MQDFGKGHARFTSPFLPPTEIQFFVSHSPQAGAGELNWSLHGDAQIRCAREGQRHIAVDSGDARASPWLLQLLQLE